MENLKLVICDGGGTVWYSMDVLFEHAQAAFSYFGLMRPDEFLKKMPQDTITEISSLKSFNSRENFPKALLALYFSDTHPEEIFRQGDSPEKFLQDLEHSIIKSWKRCPRYVYNDLVKAMGDFLKDALYQYDDSKYPLCPGVKEGLPKVREIAEYMVMLSNRLKRSTEAILVAQDIRKYFDEVNAPEQAQEPIKKPIRGVLEKIANKCSITIDDMKRKAVYIGDSNVDISSAHDPENGPLLTIAVLQGMGTKRVLERDSPYKIVNTLAEAYDVLKEICADQEKYYSEHIENLKRKKIQSA